MRRIRARAAIVEGLEGTPGGWRQLADSRLHWQLVQQGMNPDVAGLLVAYRKRPDFDAEIARILSGAAATGDVALGSDSGGTETHSSSIDPDAQERLESACSRVLRRHKVRIPPSSSGQLFKQELVAAILAETEALAASLDPSEMLHMWERQGKLRRVDGPVKGGQHGR